MTDTKLHKMTNDSEAKKMAWNKEQQISHWIVKENIAQQNLLLEDKVKVQLEERNTVIYCI